VNTVFAFEGDGQIRQYPGNYSVYLDYRAAENAEQSAMQPTKVSSPAATSLAPSTPTPHGATPAAASPTQKLSYKEKREYEQLEAQIPALEAEKAALEQQLYDNAAVDYDEMKTLSEKLATLSQTIDTATERWMELAEREG